MSWTLETLKNHLRSRKTLKSWVISQEHTHRMERYFIGNPKASRVEVDQDREVHARNLFVRLMVKLDGKPTRQGEIRRAGSGFAERVARRRFTFAAPAPAPAWRSAAPTWRST